MISEEDLQIFKQIRIEDVLKKGHKDAVEGEEYSWNFKIKTLRPLKSDIEVNIIDDRTG